MRRAFLSLDLERRSSRVMAMVLVAALLWGAMGGLAMARPDAAVAADGGATVSLQISPASTKSNSPVTATLTIACSVPGGCAGTAVTFPTNTVTGNGSRTDFSTWLSAGTCPALTKSAGQASFAFGNIPTGSSQCAFTVQSPDYVTANNAQTTITPSISGTNFAASTGLPASFTSTATRNVNLALNDNQNVASGSNFSFYLTFTCGNGSGDVGTSAIKVTQVLPANFTYTGYTVGQTGFPGSVSYDAATRTLTYSDPAGTTCQGGFNSINVTVNGAATTNGTPNPVGSTVCTTASATVTYLDGTSSTISNKTSCATMTRVVPDNFYSKSSNSGTLPNAGQFKWSGGNDNYPYTYPGNWDRSGNPIRYTLNLTSNGKNGGATFAVTDPLPCLDNYSGKVYSSNAPGVTCANPAFIPTKVLPPNGFTATTADKLTLIYTDGSTATVPFVSGVGWVIPASPAVSEIDFPQMPGQAQNTTDAYGPMQFFVEGYAATGAKPDSLLRNTATARAYLTSSGALAGGPSTQSANVLVLDPASTSNTVLRPTFSVGQSGQCTEFLYFAEYGNTLNAIEIPSAPSKAIYFDYLAPVDGSLAPSSLSRQFQVQQVHSSGGYGLQQNGVTAGFTTPAITATVTPNYNGTGRILYSWVVPAGTISLPGNYSIYPDAFDVNLVNGCAGVYQNDVTMGYGAPVDACYYGGIAAAPARQSPAPYNQNGSSKLTSNSVGTGNWCGKSGTVTINAINPGFSIAKVVQGNLDSGASTGPGHVSPAGGSATFLLQMANTGQSNLTNPVLYDLLPRVGDTPGTSTSSRGSQFATQLSAVGVLPANVTVSYSTASNPCRPEVLPSNAGCVNDWSSTPPSNLATTSALRFNYTGTLYVNGAGTSTLSIPISVNTPAATAGQAAINTVAANATGGTSLLSPAESSPVRLESQNGLTVTKSTSRTAFAKPGDVIPVTFTVKNITAVALSGVGVVDAITDAGSGASAPTVTCAALSGPAGTCSGTSTTLQAGQTATFTASYTVTQADVDHGRVSDVGTASGTPAVGSKLTASSNTVTVPVVATPAVSLSKASSSVVAVAGDPIAYTFIVTNSGNQTLSSISVAEGAFTGSGAAPTVSCPAVTSLAPAASITCTATYSTSQADVDAGSVSNTATASASSPDGSRVSSQASTAVTRIASNPALSVRKSADVTSGTYTAGQQVTYKILVTNTGNVTVSNVKATDSDFTGSGQLGPITPSSGVTLAPGVSQVFTATYTLTQADVDRGSTSNTATASGTAPDGASVTPKTPSTVVLPAPPQPSLAVVKSASPAAASKAGDAISYSFQLTNTGNVTLSGVNVAEGTFTGTGAVPSVNCPPAAGSLLPGATVVCTATYLLTQADVNAGVVANSATGSATAPNGDAVRSLPSTATVSVAAAPGLQMLKTVSPEQAAQAGDELTYTFTMSNTGNVSLSDVAVVEGAFTGSGQLSTVTCPATMSLDPGASVSCAALYTLSQQDIDSGSVSNTAFATGNAPSGASVQAGPSTAVTTIAADAGLVVAKTASVEALTAAGQSVTYSFVVTNTGNVTVAGIAIQDTDFTGSGALGVPVCPETSVSPGKTVTCTASYTVSQADIDSGALANTATVSGATAGGDPITSDPSTVTLPVTAAPAITVVKSADVTSDADYRVGKTVTYSFVATNTGNVTMTDVVVTDEAFTGTGELSTIDCPAGGLTALAPGAQVTCTATYSLTQEDIDAGQVTNTAVAKATPPTWTERGQITSSPSNAVLPTPADPSMTVVKTSDVQNLVQAGQQISFSFRITNTGNVTLTRPVISDTQFSGTGELGEITCPDAAASLLPGQSVVCTATYTATQADVDSGALRNTATVSGTTPAGGPSGPSEPTTVIIPTAVRAGLTVAKTADQASVTGVGQRITYSFTVENTGNTTVRSVAIADRDFTGTGILSSITCPEGTGTLAPGAALVCTATYATTTADVAAGSVSNTALVSGQPASGGLPIASQASTVTVAVKAAPVKGGLALTGVDVGYAGPLAAGLLIAGAVLVIIRRRRTQ